MEKMIAATTRTKLDARKTTTLARLVSSLATTVNASTIIWFVTKSPIVLTTQTSRFTATLTNALRLKSINAVTNALIL